MLINQWLFFSILVFALICIVVICVARSHVEDHLSRAVLRVGVILAITSALSVGYCVGRGRSVDIMEYSMKNSEYFLVSGTERIGNVIFATVRFNGAGDPKFVRIPGMYPINAGDCIALGTFEPRIALTKCR